MESYVKSLGCYNRKTHIHTHTHTLPNLGNTLKKNVFAVIDDEQQDIKCDKSGYTL